MKRQARYTHFAVAAARMAVEDAKLDLDKTDRTRVGCLIGTTTRHTYQPANDRQCRQ